MNIALVTGVRLIDALGGTEKVFCTLANMFAEKGNNVTAICCDPKIGKPAFPLSNSVKFVNINGSGETIYKSSRLLSKIRCFSLNKKNRKINRLSYDADNFLKLYKNKIDTNNEFDIIFAFQPDIAYFLSNIERSNIITMLHGDPATFVALDLIGNRLRGVVQVLLPCYKDEVEKKVPNATVIDIPNIVPQYSESPNYGNKLIVHIGRFCKEKRQDLVVDSFLLIAEKNPEWRLELWGETGLDKDYDSIVLDKINNSSFRDRIKICGITNNVKNVFSRASIFVFPSETEGFPLALTEAMSYGLPCIGNGNCRGIAGIIKNNETGILCNENKEAIAKNIEYLISHTSVRCAIGIAAKNDMKEYSEYKVLSKWDEVINNYENQK